MPIPVDEARDAFFDAHGRAKAEIAGGGGDVGGGRDDVAGLHRLEIAYGLAAACRLDDVDQAPEFLRVVVDDVVECVQRLAADRLERGIVVGLAVERGDHARPACSSGEMRVGEGEVSKGESRG